MHASNPIENQIAHLEAIGDGLEWWFIRKIRVLVAESIISNWEHMEVVDGYDIDKYVKALCGYRRASEIFLGSSKKNNAIGVRKQ